MNTATSSQARKWNFGDVVDFINPLLSGFNRHRPATWPSRRDSIGSVAAMPPPVFTGNPRPHHRSIFHPIRPPIGLSNFWLIRYCRVRLVDVVPAEKIRDFLMVSV